MSDVYLRDDVTIKPHRRLLLTAAPAEVAGCIAEDTVVLTQQ
jgi:hypothetical protein